MAHLWFRNLFCNADTGSYYHPEREWVGSNQEDRHYEQSDYGNDRVGWGRTATASWTFDRDHAGYAGNLSGPVPTTLVSQLHGTTKLTPL